MCGHAKKWMTDWPLPRIDQSFLLLNSVGTTLHWKMWRSVEKIEFGCDEHEGSWFPRTLFSLIQLQVMFYSNSLWCYVVSVLSAGDIVMCKYFCLFVYCSHTTIHINAIVWPWWPHQIHVCWNMYIWYISYNLLKIKFQLYRSQNKSNTYTVVLSTI